jgi:RNA polymerase sigma-70 factor (ECF subfamily)
VTVDDRDWLAERFEAHRSHLRAVAYRMLGSAGEADDAVQDAWLRLSRADTSGVDNLGGWLTTVVARVCLDLLRSRTARREQPLGVHLPEPPVSHADGNDPEQEALLAEGVGLALLVVLEQLAPAERVAFVLHDLFAVPFDEIAPIVGRSSAAASSRKISCCSPSARSARARYMAAPSISSAQCSRNSRAFDATSPPSLPQCWTGTPRLANQEAFAPGGSA